MIMNRIRARYDRAHGAPPCGRFVFGFVATLLASAIGASAYAADDLSRLKGTGEVIITSGGGSWAEAQKKAWFDPFTKDTGIKVVLIPEDHSKLLASAVAGQAEADLTLIGGGLLGGFANKGAIVPIDYSLFDKATLGAMQSYYKPKMGVASWVYSITIAYNTDKYPESGKHPKNWADYYDIKKFPGPRSSGNCDKFVDAGVIEGALLGDGVPPNKLYPLDIDRAFKILEAFKPNIKVWYDNGAATPDALLRGEVTVGTAWNNRIFYARKKKQPLQLSWEQSLIQYDYWVVMNHGPNTANAMKFLAYASRAKPQADLSMELNTGPVNNEAYKFISAERRAGMSGSPNNSKVQVYQDYTFWNAKGPDGKTNWEKALKRCVRMLSG